MDFMCALRQKSKGFWSEDRGDHATAIPFEFWDTSTHIKLVCHSMIEHHVKFCNDLLRHPEYIFQLPKNLNEAKFNQIRIDLHSQFI